MLRRVDEQVGRVARRQLERMRGSRDLLRRVPAEREAGPATSRRRGGTQAEHIVAPLVSESRRGVRSVPGLLRPRVAGPRASRSRRRMSPPAPRGCCRGTTPAGPRPNQASLRRCSSRSSGRSKRTPMRGHTVVHPADELDLDAQLKLVVVERPDGVDTDGRGNSRPRPSASVRNPVASFFTSTRRWVSRSSPSRRHSSALETPGMLASLPLGPSGRPFVVVGRCPPELEPRTAGGAAGEPDQPSALEFRRTEGEGSGAGRKHSGFRRR